MIKKAKYISAYGDIPSVRKAIYKLNKDPKVKETIEKQLLLEEQKNGKD